MRESTKRAAQQNKENRKTAAALLAVVALMAVGVFAFFRFYNTFIDGTLYAERLNQMREVTTQLFSGLEDVVKNQWRIVGGQSRALQEESPETVAGLIALMDEQAYLADLDSIQCSIIAVDEEGAYYTQDGRQGLLTERKYLLPDPEQISYVTNSLTYDETRMVFLKRLEHPVVLRDGAGTVTLRYCGISQNMEELNPYFECSAYNGNSSVYVVDDDGLKLFSSGNTGDILKGYNVFSTLDSMNYLHGTTFTSARNELDAHNIAYSNALLGDTEIYYALYKMNSAAWTLMFLVPSSYVAMNTVELVNMTMRMVLIFAVALALGSASAIFWMLKKQQKAALEVERKSNDSLEKINEELSAAIQTAEQASREAKSASKAKSEFLANMSHDIRTPMNAIVGITKLMEHDRSDPEKMDLYIHKVQSSSQHLLSLINDVLDMSKIESSEVTLNHEPISLAEQIGQVDSIIRPQVEERGQEFRIHVHEISHEYLVGDAVRLRQIFINLLSNAVKYTPYGGTVSLDLAELPSQDADCAVIGITVTDTGYGMTPEFVSHIFEPFTRAENSVTNRVQGTGLGMAITKNIIDLMGGTIRVESEPNQGSCFRVTLPVQIDKNAVCELHTKGVLLVSDEELLIRNADASFRESEIPFFTARTKAESAAVLREREVDTVLLSGFLQNPCLPSLVQMLRQEAKDAVLVFCVDYAQQERVSEILEQSGVNGLITRPFFLSNFARIVNQARDNTVAVETENGAVLNGLRFLCAEDNALNAEILEALLDINGADCTIYPNGQKLAEAFASVKPGDYDAILMDVQMPVMNGLDATRAIRRGENPLGKTIPIIAMTANAFSSDVQDCMDAGMDAHVSKPLDIGVLERTVRAVQNRIVAGGGDNCSPQEDING